MRVPVVLLPLVVVLLPLVVLPQAVPDAGTDSAQ